MNSMPRQRGMTEFQPKRALSNSNRKGSRTSQKFSYVLQWVYNGILEVCLDMEAHMSGATQITQKEPKETTNERGISLTIMGQRSIYNSIHKTQRSLDETIGFNQDDHLHRMCNETGIPEFLELQIPGILWS